VNAVNSVCTVKFFLGNVALKVVINYNNFQLFVCFERSHWNYVCYLKSLLCRTGADR